ncbi:RNA 2'-phosphotransferase [Micromonospora echinofusca]|uniref:Probable RNA 2'-phosphotransferase n=1 Tax=Micromonospora echinofusca TaxID=47858 RepID=A0ABS3VLD1_MICEH|nr:RNA 2'-phosphotransferase [Micromonospora echinofusca]MBO4205351.1 RNA--NAD 2'-phosphotransferase [Micromonospora echinofusca]
MEAAAGGLTDAALVRVSKRLSRVLRHAPESVGVTLDPHGWVPVDDLLTALARHGTQVSREQLHEVVADNDKQRFALRTGADGVTWIRASQGHSARVGVDLGLAAVAPPEVLYHGTPTTNVASILATGLHPGRRQHVHLSADVPTALTVGRRRSGSVAVLTVRAGLMAAAGYVFHRSANGVWLTAAVPAEFVRR